MATTEIIKTTCDRCDRDAPTRTTNDPPALVVDAVGEVIKYDDLCPKCRDVCRDYLRKMARRDPLRKRAPKVEAVAGEKAGKK